MTRTDPVPPPEQPTTEAGRALLFAATFEGHTATGQYGPDALRFAILATEAEARAAERKEVERLARWIVSHHVGSVDHACRECVPSRDMVIDGFQCAFHRSRAILDAVTTDTPHPYNGGTCCDQPLADHAYASVEWVASQDWHGPVATDTPEEPSDE
jgi:hypothetical protein